MVDFTLFRLRDEVDDFDEYVDLENHRATSIGPVVGEGFTAKLFFTSAPRQPPAWLAFVNQGFSNAIDWRPSRAIGALIVVRTASNDRVCHFALAFGGGRYLLKSGAYFRRYGLITALNLIAEGDGVPQLRAFDTARHGQSILRSRLQTTSASSVEVFELDVLRDLIRHATGQPADIERWGNRIGGSDALRIAADIPFAELGAFCLLVDEVAREDTYRQQFAWIDNIQPITDTRLVDELEEEVVALLRDGRMDLIQMAPPETVDWDRLSAFQYHFDTRQRPILSRRDISLDAYLGGLRLTDPDLDELSAARLRSRRVIGLDEDREKCAEWSVWQCLVAEFECDGKTYVLDDGGFFEVAADYLTQLNADVSRFSSAIDFLPAARAGITEPEYNRETAAASAHFLLLDADEIPAEGARGGIELCDLLTDERQFVHVKRYGSSKQLSHLFAQARIAGELLVTNPAFRAAVRDRLHEIAGDDGPFNVVEEEMIRPGELEIVLAIIKRWNEANLDALPFFAKIDLRRTIVELSSRGFRVAVLRVPYA